VGWANQPYKAHAARNKWERKNPKEKGREIKYGRCPICTRIGSGGVHLLLLVRPALKGKP
jgi:hypothetical protein